MEEVTKLRMSKERHGFTAWRPRLEMEPAGIKKAVYGNVERGRSGVVSEVWQGLRQRRRAVTHPMGAPDVPSIEEQAYRAQLFELALSTLKTSVSGPTVFTLDQTA